MTPDPKTLDNPIWTALTTVHASVAKTCGDAARYPAEISPMAAMRQLSESAFADLATLVSADETVGLFTASEVEVPPDWEIERARWIDQMAFDGPFRRPDQEFSVLTKADVPEMLALTALTEPGPFKVRTIEMGLYLGVRTNDGALAAMAGERLRTDAFTEISAVCTSPDHRGKGYASALIDTLCRRVVDRGQTPILHVKSENGARALYEKLGFRLSRPIRLTAIRRR